MGFWNQVIKGKSREVYDMEILNSHDTEEIRDILRGLKNARINYNIDNVSIYPNKKDSPYRLDFHEYGPHKELRYKYTFDDIIIRLEMSANGEMALFSIAEYPSMNILTALRFHLE